MASSASSSAPPGRPARPLGGRFSASLGNLRGRRTARGPPRDSGNDGAWASSPSLAQDDASPTLGTASRDLPLPLPPPPPLLPPKAGEVSSAAAAGSTATQAQAQAQAQAGRRSSVDATPTPTPTNEEEAYFDAYRLSRPGSIYSLSRVSFSSQIAQLASIQMPQASSLANSIASMPSAVVAARALKDAAEQLQRWTYKASELLSGLDAEDDVEWAAAAGRDGLGEVDVAITRFEGLIQVYVGAVEDLQLRQDIAAVPAVEQKHLVDQIEKIAKEWQNVKDSLQNVKYQVELAMEWEELWNSVLGDIGQEIDALSSLVFEMEEKRHQSNLNGAAAESAGLDIGELETIVDSPTAQMGMSTMSNRFSFSPAFAVSPLGSPGAPGLDEESGLLGIFARMQPLRASLDFLPMRLAAFHNRSSTVFPTACDELQRKKTSLEQQWKRLESDAEALRRELGEDRWVLVFKNAGKQASRMMDSVVRSITKLDEALDSNTQLSHAPSTSKKIDNYDAKKLHYSPAIERVLAIVDKGIKERLTVNGEIIRLQTDLRQKWQTLQADIRNMDSILKHFNGQRHKQSRDSVSTVFSVSSEHSFVGSAVDTPGSSPASSIYLPNNRNSTDESKSSATDTLRIVTTPKPRERRHSHIPIPSPTASTFRVVSTPSKAPYVSPYSQTAMRAASQPIERPRRAPQPQPPQTNTLADRPRWSVATNPNNSLSTPKPHSTYPKTPPQSRSAASHAYSNSQPQSPPPQSRSASSHRHYHHQQQYAPSSSSSSPILARKPSASNLSTTASASTQKITTPYRPPSRAALGPGPYAQDPARRTSSQAPPPGGRRPASLALSASAAAPQQHADTTHALAPAVQPHPPMSPSMFAAPAALAGGGLSPGPGRRASVLPLPKARTSLGGLV